MRHNEKWREAMAKRKGSKYSFSHRKAISEGKKGVKFSQKHIENLKIARQGKKPALGHKVSEETRQILRKANKGKHHTKETRQKMSIKQKGENSYNWKGGITPINLQIRHSFEYKLWREAVFKRDNWTCVWCKKRGVKLNADHIKPFSLYPELRFALDNGRTLCVDCHKKTDTFGYKMIYVARKSD